MFQIICTKQKIRLFETGQSDSMIIPFNLRKYGRSFCRVKDNLLVDFIQMLVLLATSGGRVSTTRQCRPSLG